MTEPHKPMSQTRLELLRSTIALVETQHWAYREGVHAGGTAELLGELAGELLADRELLIAQITGLRARVPVSAEDVEHAGVTWAKVNRWLVANGLNPILEDDLPCANPTGESTSDLRINRRGIGQIHEVIGRLTRDKTSAWRLLDEMAAMEVSDDR